MSSEDLYELHQIALIDVYMLNQISSESLFVDYYAQWVAVYKEGAIRKVPLRAATCIQVKYKLSS